MEEIVLYLELFMMVANPAGAYIAAKAKEKRRSRLMLRRKLIPIVDAMEEVLLGLNTKGCVTRAEINRVAGISKEMNLCFNDQLAGLWVKVERSLLLAYLKHRTLYNENGVAEKMPREDREIACAEEAQLFRKAKDGIWGVRKKMKGLMAF